jgi:hypothetical protein
MQEIGYVRNDLVLLVCLEALTYDNDNIAGSKSHIITSGIIKNEAFDAG